ncbi:MAG: hypothetical protein Q9187_009342, partial [Circinaria calcarea]
MAGGSWLGALVSGFISDILGRKKAIMIAAIIWLVPRRILTRKKKALLTFAARCIGSTITCASQNIGMLIVGRLINGISYGSSFIEGPAAFRVPWGLQMIPAIILFAGMIFLPESPRWLARKDRWEDCHNVLTLVHGKGDRTAPFVLRELQEIREMCEFERNNADVTYLELLKPNMINRTHIGVFTQIWS